MAREIGFDGHRVRPQHVWQAVLADDKKRLSELGRRGAASRQRLRVAHMAHQNRLAHEVAQEEAALRDFHLELIAEDDARYFRELHEECHFDECPID